MQLTPPLIAALFAGLCGLLSVALAIRVTVTRSKYKTEIGFGDNMALQQVIRVHANNAEYTALGLVVLALIETLGAPSLAVYALGGGLLVGRLLHAQGLSSATGPTFGRIAGQSLTWLAIALACLYAVYFWARAI
ncbi:MAG: MAPEG family protein [Alphaproteobacteria bacterium]|nr:MAPEG family protein [Alphaproteobacteria bacterium]